MKEQVLSDEQIADLVNDPDEANREHEYDYWPQQEESNTVHVDNADRATALTVRYIRERLLDGDPVFDDLVQIIINGNPSMQSVQKVWQQGLRAVSTDAEQTPSGRNELYQQIDVLYSQMWKVAEQEAMERIVAKLMVEVLDG